MAVETIQQDDEWDATIDTPDTAVHVLNWHIARLADGAPWHGDTETEVREALMCLARS
jgi:hypothetical protein